MNVGRRLASVGLVVVAVAAVAPSRADTPVPPPPAPATPTGLRALAGELEDTAAFIDQLIARKVNCDGSLAWHGETISVREKMRRTCGTPERAWDQGQHLWRRSQDWLIKTGAIDKCGDTGTLPNKGDGYCTRCPAPYDVTAKALRDDAESLRKMASALDCGGGVVAAAGVDQRKKQEADERKKREDADEKRKEDAAALQRAQDAQHGKEADAAREKKEEEREAQEKRDEQEAQRHKDLADQYAKEKDTADKTNASQAASVNDMASAAASAHGGETNGVRGISNQFHLAVGLGIGVVPMYDDTDQTKDVKANSSTTAAFGLGPVFELGFSPLVTPYFSAGLMGTMLAGGTALAGGGTYFLSGVGAARAMAGYEAKISGLFRVGYGGRLGGTSMNSGGGIVAATSSGSFSHTLTEIGAGVHFCVSRQKSDDPKKRGLSEDFCDSGLQFWGLSQSSSKFDSAGTPVAIEMDYFSHGSYGVDVQLWHDYPRPNSPAYPGAQTTNGGPLILLSVRLITMDEFSGW